MRKLNLYIISAILAISLSGCPHMTESIVKQSGQAAKELAPPPGYNPKYLVSNTSLSGLEKSDSLRKLDSSAYVDSLRKQIPAGMNFAEISGAFGKFADSLKRYEKLMDRDSISARNYLKMKDSLVKYYQFAALDSKMYDSLNAAIEGDSAIESQIKETKDFFSGNISKVKIDVTDVISDNYPSEIEVRAVVHDDDGYYVTGLAPPKFAGKGDYRDYWSGLADSSACIDKNIKNFTVEEINSETSEPFAIAFALDHSPSMGDKRARNLQKGVRTITSAIKKGDMISVVKFGGKIVPEIPLTDDRNKYRQVAVDGLDGDYGFGTAMYEGIVGGIYELKKAPPEYRKILILFSDGGDNQWGHTADSVYRFARENGVKIYPIAYGAAEEEPLKKLCDYSGGKFYRIYSINEFPYVFAELYLTLNNYYKITYTPPECDDMHRVGVTLNVPELKISDLRARGYYDRSIFKKFDPIGTIAFVNIEFEFGKAALMPEALPIIEKIAAELKKSPFLKLKIYGHTDDVGKDEDNLKLSIDRANAVLEKLAEMGIERSRLSAEGFGESKPLVPNSSDENRKKNRRTEFIILDK